jgi:hypothetical protein
MPASGAPINGQIRDLLPLFSPHADVPTPFALRYALAEVRCADQVESPLPRADRG